MNTLVEPEFALKIMFQSWLPPLPWCPTQRLICLAFIWLVWLHVGLVLEGIEPPEHVGRARFCSKNHVPKLTTTAMLPHPKIDFSRLHMTCLSFRSIFPGGSWALWTRWSSQIWLEKSCSWDIQGPPPPPDLLYVTIPVFCLNTDTANICPRVFEAYESIGNGPRASGGRQ